jgi:hypothetical protein
VVSDEDVALPGLDQLDIPGAQLDARGADDRTRPETDNRVDDRGIRSKDGHDEDRTR